MGERRELFTRLHHHSVCALFRLAEAAARSARFRAQPSAAGLLIVAGSLAIFLAGLLGAELFLTRISFIGVLAGSIWFLFGWRHVRLLAFPLLLLILMVPLPAIDLQSDRVSAAVARLARRRGEC